MQKELLNRARQNRRALLAAVADRRDENIFCMEEARSRRPANLPVQFASRRAAANTNAPQAQLQAA
jgi:hypothetical protein